MNAVKLSKVSHTPPHPAGPRKGKFLVSVIPGSILVNIWVISKYQRLKSISIIEWFLITFIHFSFNRPVDFSKYLNIPNIYSVYVKIATIIGP
jgi:hypothetical protein